MKVALVCIAKDEDIYLEEWIKYNKKLGFDRIFIYENDWVCKIDDDIITKIPFPGRIMQLKAYNDFIAKYYEEYDYAAFFDCDEFLVLKKHKTIQEFLNDYNHPVGIGINWQFYGHGGKKIRESNSLIKQFTRRGLGVNQHVKCIINLKSGCKIFNPHFPNMPVIDTRRIMFSGPFNIDGNDEVAIINHYHVKTYEDWLIRCKRGRSDRNDPMSINIWEENMGKDIEIEDYCAYNFLYGNNIN
jgi:hypothetical protein